MSYEGEVNVTNDYLSETFPLGLVYKKQSIPRPHPSSLAPYSQKCTDFYRAPLQFGSDAVCQNKER